MQLDDKIIRHKIFLNRLAGSLSNQLQAGVSAARDVAIKALFSTSDIRNININKLQSDILTEIDIRSSGAVQVLVELTKVEQNFFVKIVSQEIDTEYKKVDEQKLENAIFNKPMGVGQSTNTPNRKMLKAYTALADQHAKAILQPIKDAQLKPREPVDIAEEILAKTAGIFEAQNRTLANTSVYHVSSVVKDEVMRNNLRIATHFRWISVLDSRTTDFCRKRNGKIYPIEGSIKPQAHWNCRSDTAPVFKDEL